MDFRNTRRARAMAAAAMALAPLARARAQGLGAQATTAATSWLGALPAIAGLVLFAITVAGVGNGSWQLYKHYSPRHRSEGALAFAAFSFAAAFIAAGGVAFVALGAMDLTGGAPTAASGGTVIFN